MLSSMSVCPGINGGTLPRPSFHYQNLGSSFGPLKTPIQFKHRIISGGGGQFPSIRYGKSRRFSATADIADFPSAIEDEDEDDVISVQEPEKLKVVVKAMEKPRLVLKFVWMEKNIGIGLDKVVPGHGTIPLSPYFFWPRKDAWEELKTTLESKPWISQKKMIILLNQATDIINLWQQSGGNLT